MGLRYGRGMNFGLLKLWKENKFEKYDAFLLLTNDTEFQNPMIANKMIRILKNIKKLEFFLLAQSHGVKDSY